MIITEARRQRRSLYQVVLDDRREISVDVRTFDESAYRVGGSITEEQLEALQRQSMYNRARERALYLLGIRDYACRELEQKLHSEATPDIAAAVVERLREVGLLDDERYAERMARSLSEYKQMPRRRVMQELQRRGVARDTAAAAAEEIECEDFEQALAILRKRYYNKMTDRDARQRVVAALARRGFSYEAVRQAMQAFDDAAHIEIEETEDQWR